MKILIISLFLVLAACSTAPTTQAVGNTAPAGTPPTAQAVENTAPAGTPPTASQHSRPDYVVQPGDVLDVSVWKEKDLQREVMVRPDGGLNFPLAGDVTASGKTLEQLQKDIANRLAKYVPDPAVTVAVKQSAGNIIYVVGKVNRPGNYTSNRTMDVMQALSMAGGLSPYASVNKIKILRRDSNGELKSFLFKYSRVEKGEDLEQNITLQGGDVVVVP
jgi:polysaccharide export outer membrane protein